VLKFSRHRSILLEDHVIFLRANRRQAAEP
jgi:hypothetical protein